MFVEGREQYDNRVPASLEDFDGAAERVPLERRVQRHPREILRRDALLEPRFGFVPELVAGSRQRQRDGAQRIFVGMFQRPFGDRRAREVDLLQVPRPG
ncbi:MAG: hypothetical protein NTY53_15795, partial [Kiritimatiellaeota bacterium]|nr:hypothetical protein [Kiritimatiellota bacterium]